MHGIGEALGLKAATLLAGFIGAIASLAYMRELTPAKAVLAVVVGTGCAAYVTPLAMGWLNLTGSAGENAAAFIVGIIGMNLVGAFYKGGERLRDRGIDFRNGGGDNNRGGDNDAS
jgi:hypothetical protein